jgi:hypothetical protein
MPGRLVLLTIAALAVAGTACSDDGGGGGLTAEEQAYVDAMVAAADEDEDGESDLLDIAGEDETRCFASEWITIIGVDRLEAAGIDPEEFAGDDVSFEELGLERDEADELIDAFGSCDIDLRDAMIDSMVADAGDSDVMRGCLEAGLTDESVRALMVAAFTEGEDALEEGNLDDPEAERAFGALFGCAFTGGFDDSGDDG